MSKRKFHRDVRRSIEVLKASGYVCSPCNLGPFQIIGISSTDICLVHVSDSWPVKPWLPDQLREIPAPANTKKLCHFWPRRARWPKVQEV